jgi:hypothetical protein
MQLEDYLLLLQSLIVTFDISGNNLTNTTLCFSTDKYLNYIGAAGERSETVLANTQCKNDLRMF